jgi:outer membrane lipoprotein carrier protein
MKRFVASAIAVLSLTVAGAQSNDPVALAAKVQQRYNGIADIQADFVQTGKLRFNYSNPEKKDFVSDGVRLYAHMVADKQVFVSPAPSPDEGEIPAMFLAGQSDLARDFTPSFTSFPGAAPGLVTLKLIPKKKNPEYDYIGIGVDPGSLQIQFLMAADVQGGRSSFSFTNLKENRGLSDKEFEFRIPRGVDVVTNGGKTK